MSDENEKKVETKYLEVIWGQKHHIYYANSFNMRVNDAEIQIDFGTIQNILGSDKLLSNDQVIMTPKSAKTLAFMLSKAIENLEGRIGEIKLDSASLEPMLQVLSKVSKPE
jgi:Protein of unknown function (DUF3467)